MLTHKTRQRKYVEITQDVGCSHNNPRSCLTHSECLLQTLLFHRTPFPNYGKASMAEECTGVGMEPTQIWPTSEQVESSHYQCLWRWHSGSIWNSDWCAGTVPICTYAHLGTPSCSALLSLGAKFPLLEGDTAHTYMKWNQYGPET